MIRIHCVNCKTLLEIDDGFAGGVCRCVHCGKMQAVPKASRSGARAAGPEVGSRGFEGLERTLGTGVRILSPSSLSGSGLGSDNLSAAPSKETIAAPAAKSNWRMLMFGAIAAIVALIALILWVMSGGSGEKGSSVPDPSSTENNADIHVAKLSPRARTLDTPQEIPPAFAPPSFGGVALTEPSVVYLIDRSGLSEESVSQIKQAVLKSIDSLHTDQQFQVIVWISDNGDSDTPIPASGLTRATPEALASTTADLAGDKDRCGASR